MKAIVIAKVTSVHVSFITNTASQWPIRSRLLNCSPLGRKREVTVPSMPMRCHEKVVWIMDENMIELEASTSKVRSLPRRERYNPALWVP